MQARGGARQGSAAARNDTETDEEDAMPIVHIEILEGRPASKKRALISEVTDAVVRSLEVQPAQVRVLLREVPPEQWAVGGVPMSERVAATAGDGR
jgi:4-oxalocrotonate tautomerase